MISTHILNTSKGSPAEEIWVELEYFSQNQWAVLEKLKTNSDGRASFSKAKDAGIYRLNFLVEEYFIKSNSDYFFPRAQVEFKISDLTRKYHVPLLLNPFGYSTYRGS